MELLLMKLWEKERRDLLTLQMLKYCPTIISTSISQQSKEQYLDKKEKVPVIRSLYNNEGLVKEFQKKLEILSLISIQQTLKARKAHVQYHKATFDQAHILSQDFDNKEGSVDISHEKPSQLLNGLRDPTDLLRVLSLFLLLEPSDSTQTKWLQIDKLHSTKVCRQGGYFGNAVYLAEKYQEHDWYLKVQLEDLKDYQKALKYIGRLQFVEIDEELLKDYNALLLFSQSKFALGRAYENEAASSVPDGAQNVNRLREHNSSSSSDDEDPVRFNWHELDFNSLFSRWLSESSTSEDVDSSEDESESESTLPDERLNNAYGEQLDHNLSDDHSSSIQEYPRSLLCETCMARVRNVRFGCGHVACSGCTKNKDKCPECEKHITKRTLMYI